MSLSDNPYPNSFLLQKALRELEHIIAIPGNIEYLRDLPSKRGGALGFAMDVSAFIDAIEGERNEELESE